MSTDAHSAARICAVVVTYNPSGSFTDNLVALAAQVRHIFIVDNTPQTASQSQLSDLQGDNYTVVSNGKNLGLAAALNIGLKNAIAADFEYILTFDQDSRISDGFVFQMVKTYAEYGHSEKVAIVAPHYIDRESGVEIELSCLENGTLLECMTSGSMIPVRVVRQLGTFDESLFIDAVDKEFCLRARRAGMVILQSPALLFHSLGRITHHQLFGRSFGVTNHSAGRRYYITRNALRLFMQYPADRRWMWHESRRMFHEILRIALVEEDKINKLRAIAAGAFDALRGRMGKQVEL